MRILIATVTAGAGHLQAAAALEEAWRSLRPRDLVERLDVLDFTPRLYRKVYVEGYVKVVEHAPEGTALGDCRVLIMHTGASTDTDTL